MSPRRLDPNQRTALVKVAARLISLEGPAALTTRRLAAEAGTSTMAVYTYFGGMKELIREIVREGFARLASLFEQVELTSDPVADLAALGRAYRHNALSNPHLHSVMFGGYGPAGFEPAADDLRYGRYTLSRLIEFTARCVTARRFRPDDPVLIAHHMWLAVHGTVALELGAYLEQPYDGDRCFETQLVSLMAGAGDGFDSATVSVTRSAERFSRLVAAQRG